MFPPLYAIIDTDVAAAAGFDAAALARAYMDGGARLLQLRAKRQGSGQLLELVDRLVAFALPVAASIVVNDRADVARMAAAAGVHLGQDDLPPAAARQMLGAAALVGFSTHTIGQLDAAMTEPISYVAVGPVFGTTTKATGYDAVGLDLVRRARDLVDDRRPGLPIVAIGGITLDTARSVIEAGATSVAVISDLLRGVDPLVRVSDYLRELA